MSFSVNCQPEQKLTEKGKGIFKKNGWKNTSWQVKRDQKKAFSDASI